MCFGSFLYLVVMDRPGLALSIEKPLQRITSSYNQPRAFFASDLAASVLLAADLDFASPVSGVTAPAPAAAEATASPVVTDGGGFGAFAASAAVTVTGGCAAFLPRWCFGPA